MFTPPRRTNMHRSTEAPMDFQFTSRENDEKPVWQLTEEELNARKRQRQESEPPAPFRATTPARTFGTNQNIPFIFNTPAPQMPTPHPWTPPAGFSAAQAFPTPDIDMAENDPVKPNDKSSQPRRAVATGALQRIYKARHRSRSRRRNNPARSSGEDVASDSEEDDDYDPRQSVTTSHHYTLNMPSAPAPQSDVPYILLGYLQFFFNLSLVLLFLYLLVQTILTVQRDVEHRISEHSLDIVQTIAMCAMSFKNNGCADNRVPHMIQPCAEWETCMNRDPTIVGRARVGAEMIGEIVNSFVESISWKTFLFSLTSLAFLTVFINSLLSLYRSRLMPSPAPIALAPTPQFPYPPPNFGGYISSPTPAAAWPKPRHGDDDDRSPTRRRKLEGGDSLKIR
ncbi:Di-sulfide bridge nucleocytoplasmic transport domain-containing protein [Flagelloscypha sp. PMI_526]|nr:Di-sulfide bridge nucleocytoplasmic transport domain-containing protein [Flagelloscypha sp. PMI_526]